MNIQSARALKAEIASEVVPPAVAAVSAAGGFSITTFSLRRMTKAQPLVALGLAPGKKSGDVHLAVRLQRHSLADRPHSSMISSVARATRSTCALSAGSPSTRCPGTARA